MRRPIGKTAVSLKVLIFGKEGTRKSNTAIQIAQMPKKDGTPKKILLIDMEYKAIEGFNEAYLEDKGVNFGNICEMRTRDLDTIQILVDKCVQGKPIPVINEEGVISTTEFEKDADGNDFIADAVIFDSISVLNDLMVEGRQEIVKRRTNIKIINDGLVADAKELALDNAGLQFLDYGKIRTKCLKIVRDLQAMTGKDVIYISRAKDAKESKIVDKKIQVIDLGYEVMDATGFKSFLPYEVMLHIHTKNDGEFTMFNILKDSYGVHKKGEISTEFSLLDYTDFVNNNDKTIIQKVRSYDDNIKKAEIFTEDSEISENDVKLKLYKDVIDGAKASKENSVKIKEYCKQHNITNLMSPELISRDDLVEMKKIIS